MSREILKQSQGSSSFADLGTQGLPARLAHLTARALDC